MAPPSQILLLTAGTPNGHKASIMLEELGMPYEVKGISIGKNEQKEDWFLKVNPNGRIPAIVDRNLDDLPVFESGAILMHLCEQYDKQHSFLPPISEPKKRAEVISWLMWQMGGLGPMQGQANHFTRYAPERIEYGVNRYQNETKRLWGVMEQHLANHKFLANDTYSIADIACLSWIFSGPWAGVQHDDFPNVKAWMERCLERPAVQKGLDVPDKNSMKEAMSNPEKAKQMVDMAKGMMVSHKADD